jgi:hypothetical protein
MSKTRVLELLPFFALFSVAVIVSSTALASAGFAFPDLFGKWSFGQPASPAAGTVNTVQKSSLLLGDLTVPQSFNLPLSGFSMFRSPMTSTQTYSRTLTTPDGPVTQAAERAYDPATGLWTTTVTSH